MAYRGGPLGCGPLGCGLRYSLFVDALTETLRSKWGSSVSERLGILWPTEKGVQTIQSRQCSNILL